MRRIFGLTMFLVTAFAYAQSPSFSGEWQIDFRTPSERKRNVECGIATFALTQEGDRITGDHSMAPAGCARVNEGGPGTVRGIVVNGVAVLFVTSGRTGAIVLGTATLKGSNRLQWRYREEIRPGEPEGDAPLILDSAVLVRAKAAR